MFKKIKSNLLLIFALLFIFAGCNSTNNSVAYDNVLPFNPAVKTAVLDNGLTYYVMSNKEPKNRIFIRLVVNAGACNEDEDQNGIAHLCEHMAFEGSEHFQKDEMDQFFRSIGSEENNAFTNYSNTVYHFSIPADDKEVFEKAMLIVHDWACAVSYEEEALDKERKVVVEEWRLGQGVNERISKEINKYELADSKFLEHDVIGDPEILKNISRDRVYDFYKKWYRPELMSVIVVGDLPQNELENAVINAMKDIPASNERINQSVYTVPIRENKDIVIVKDKEIKNTLINIDARIKDYAPYTTVEQYYQEVLFNFAGYIFNQRIEELSKKSDSPWIAGGIGQKYYATNTYALYLWFRPKDGLFDQAFKQFLDEFERFMQYGVTDKELERMRFGYNVEMNNYKKRIKKMDSESYTWDFVAHFENGTIPLAPMDYYELTKLLIQKVTPEDIKAVALKYFGDRGELISITAPESEEGIPSKEQIMEIWTNYKAENLEQIVEEDINEKIMERPAAVKVVSKNKVTDLGVTEYVLQNGVKIITKKTDFEDDKIRMSAVSKGGIALVSDEDYPSAKAAISYQQNSGIDGFTKSQLDKFLLTKTVGFNIGMNRWNEYINGNSNNEDIEIVLQLVNQIFTNPQFTQEGWDKTIVDYRLSAKNRGATPADIFNNEVKKVVYDNSRNFTIVDDAFVDAMNKNDAERIFRDRFADISDFEFVFTGDFNEKKLIELCRSYLGTIKTYATKEECVFEYFNLPQGTEPVYVKKQTEHKATVVMVFRGNLSPEEDISKKFTEETLTSLYFASLQTQLFDYIRKELGGTYGVNLSIDFDGYPERQYEIYVEFGCEPERVEELSNAIISYMKIQKTDGVEQSYVEQESELLRRNVETMLRENVWWHNRVLNSLVNMTEPLNVVKMYQEDIPEQIKKEVFDKIAKQYLDTENYYRLVLMPEE